MAETFLLEILIGGKDIEVMSNTECFWYDETIYGSSTFYLHAFSEDWQKWDQIVTSKEPLDVQLRWGVADELTERWSPWKSVLISQGRYRLSSGAVEVWLRGVDAGFVMSERAHGLAFTNESISRMVAELARENGFRSSIAATRGQHTLYQCDIPDAQFIQNNLLPKAVNGAGRGDYKFYFRNGRTLVFAPPDLNRVHKNYQILTDPSSVKEGDVDRLDVEFRRLFRGAEETHAVEYRGFDPLQKEPVTWIMNDRVSRLPGLAPTYPQSPRVPGAIRAVTEQTAAAVRDVAQSEWGVDARKLFRATLETEFDVSVGVGEVVSVAVQGADGRPHWSNGRWLVHGTRSWFRPRGMATTLLLERRGFE